MTLVSQLLLQLTAMNSTANAGMMQLRLQQQLPVVGTFTDVTGSYLPPVRCWSLCDRQNRDAPLPSCRGSRSAGHVRWPLSRSLVTFGMSSPCAPAGGITEEQYHSHHQQLVQMQRQQLERLQSDRAMNRHAAPQTAQVIPVSFVGRAFTLNDVVSSHSGLPVCLFTRVRPTLERVNNLV